ncbi:MAG TPA: metallophosphoesterase [Solirubrobacteraceae bacterium]
MIRAAADLHGNLPSITACDLLLLAGDIVPPAIERDIAESLDWLTGPFDEWLTRLPAREIVAIAGNHDFAFEAAPIPQLHWTYLRDSEVTIDAGATSLRIYGTPWTPAHGQWAFEADPAGLTNVFAAIPAGLDILLSHGPPRGYGDRASLDALRGAFTHAGSPELSDAIARAQPAICCYGHIHEDGGYHGQIGSTRLYNVALVDENYHLVRDAAQL